MAVPQAQIWQNTQPDPFKGVKDFMSMRDQLGGGAPASAQAPQQLLPPSNAFGGTTGAQPLNWGSQGSTAAGFHAVASDWNRLTNDQRVSALMQAIAKGESGGNYTARAKGSTASGAYQFTDPTWRGLGYSGSAYQASAAQQDAAARQLVSQYLAKYGTPQAVVNAWYGGPGYATKGASAYPGGNNGGLTLGANWDRKLQYLNAIIAQLLQPTVGGSARAV